MPPMRVSKKTYMYLTAMKRHPRQSYNEVIWDLIKEHIIIQDSGECGDERLPEIVRKHGS